MTLDRWNLPAGPRLCGVDSFAALVAAPLRGMVNAACWPRRLDGDFGAVVAALEARLTSDCDALVQVEEAALAGLALDEDGEAAPGRAGCS